MRRFEEKAILISWSHPTSDDDAVVFNVYRVDETTSETVQIANQIRDQIIGGAFSFAAPFEKPGQFHFEVEAYDKQNNIFSERVKSESFIWGNFLAPPQEIKLFQTA